MAPLPKFMRLLVIFSLLLLVTDADVVRGVSRRGLQNDRKGKKSKEDKKNQAETTCPMVCIPFPQGTPLPLSILANPTIPCQDTNDCTSSAGPDPCLIELSALPGEERRSCTAIPCFCDGVPSAAPTTEDEGRQDGGGGAIVVVPPPPVVQEPPCVELDTLPQSVIDANPSICQRNVECNQFAPSSPVSCRLFFFDPNAVIGSGFLNCDINNNHPQFARLCGD